MSGDGTFVGKQLHVVNLTFSILDKGKRAHSSDGNYCLAIFRQERYDEMTALSDIHQETQNLSSIQVNALIFDIMYFLGGDWKFLALVTGKLVRERGH